MPFVDFPTWLWGAQLPHLEVSASVVKYVLALRPDRRP